MDLVQAVTSRRSIRKFRKDPVPEALIREILDAARWSPSWGNTQPWEIVVVSGESLERLRRANRQRILDKSIPEPDTPMPGIWPETLKRRYTEVGKRVLTSLQIAREDREARDRYTADMFAFFDAPCLLLFLVDKSLSREYAMLDIGAVLQTACLLIHARGLGSCILAASVSYPDAIRETVPIPEGRAVIIGAALGYPEQDAPINRFVRERATPDEFTTWVR